MLMKGDHVVWSDPTTGLIGYVLKIAKHYIDVRYEGYCQRFFKTAFYPVVSFTGPIRVPRKGWEREKFIKPAYPDGAYADNIPILTNGTNRRR